MSSFLDVIIFVRIWSPTASLQYTVSLVQWVIRLLHAQGAAVRLLEMRSHLQWDRVLLLAMSRYIGDPDGIWSLTLPSLGCFTWLHVNNVESRHDHTSHAFPGSIPLLAGPPPPRNTVTGQSPGQVAGGSPEALQFHSNTQSHWSSGPTICFLPGGGQRFASRGCTHTYNGTGLSC